MSSFFHSIRWRLQAWHGLMLLAVVMAFCVAAYMVGRGYQIHRIETKLMNADRTVFHVMMEGGKTEVAPGSLTKGPAFSFGELTARLSVGQVSIPPGDLAFFSSTEPGYAYFCMCDHEGRILLQSPNAPKDIDFPAFKQGDGHSEEQRFYKQRREMLRTDPAGFRSIVGVDVSPELDEMGRFAISLAVVGLAVWLLGLLGGWWLAGRAIKPIHAISRTASRIAEGNLEERISTGGTDSELDQLSHVLNHTFERLHRSFERQRRFTSDASHELRTPVTILLTETQRALRRERSPEEYREVIETCRSAALRMKKLTEALLLLARQESVAEGALGELCDLAAICREVMSDFQATANERGISMDSELREVRCKGDPAALSILFANLVGNAVDYNRQGGRVRVSCDAVDGFASVTVSDDGPGISAEDLPHVFERFYRADKARTGTDGHAGLGLAIAMTIAENHQGTITVESQPGRGATFTVRLPLAIG